MLEQIQEVMERLPLPELNHLQRRLEAEHLLTPALSRLLKRRLISVTLRERDPVTGQYQAKL